MVAPTKPNSAARQRALAVNEAIRDIANKHELTARDIAESLHVSTPTVFSWFRSQPTRAPKMALALLCHNLGIKSHPLLLERPGRRGRG